ncbi:MAG: S8 family serine peptidase [Flavobacteriales bacterium]|mgnify:FL=1|jgi:minor extracellular serine protease Vpr|nr:S8 family serine peptidase [Flavobacteriales bacterium]
MKQLTLFLIFLLNIIVIPSHLFSQHYLSANDRADINKIMAAYSDLESFPIRSKYPVHMIKGEAYVSFVGKIEHSFDAKKLENEGCIVNATINHLISLKVPLKKIHLIDKVDHLNYLSLSKRMNTALDRAVKDVRADSVHLGLGNLPEGYYGDDVIVGVTDWGFDYTSPIFYDTALQQTRIIAAWDQYKLSGPSPTNFSYGTEFSNANSLLQAGSDTSNIYSYSTHGTHVASIAGGSGAGTEYRGIAPGVNFLFVTFLVDEGAVLDAWEWMYQKSLQEGKRLVVNMSWGLYHAGTLDGNSVLSNAISAYTDLGVVFVNSGGNNGNVDFHLKHDFSNDTIQTRVNFYSYSAHEYMWGQSIHSWGEVGNSFSNKIQIKNSSGIVLAESPFYSTASVSAYIDTFIVANQDTVWYNISSDEAHPMNGRPQMRFRVKCTNQSLRVMLNSTATEGLIHYWNVTELSNDVGNWGMPFTTFQSGSISGDNENGISEPSCADDVISVAAYATGWTTPAGNPVGGGIASFSSRGPRFDGVMKPDIAAPGVSIAAALSSFTDGQYTTIGSVEFNNRTYYFARLSGTSMASPMVAGVAALILDAHPTISASAVKDIILQTAREDNKTGVLPDLGDPTWGHGKVNALAAVEQAVLLNNIENIGNNEEIKIYPNPVSDEMVLDISTDVIQFTLKDLSGKTHELLRNGNRFNCSHLNSGIYFISFEDANKSYVIPFIKK